MELIDRQALMDALYEKEYSTLCPLDEVSGVVDSIPTVDAVPVVHGRWLSAYEYGLKLGITDAEALEGLKEDKWWKF